MLYSHKTRFKIKRVRKKPSTPFALSRELRNIGESLNLSIDEEEEGLQSARIIKVTFGSKHSLSQFAIEIAFDSKCDLVVDQCSIDITLCRREEKEDDEDDDPFVDIEFEDDDIKSMLMDIQRLIDDGDFEALGTKLSLIRYLDDIHNFCPSLLLHRLNEDGNGEGSVHREIEFVLKTLPNILEYKRVLEGPSIVYAQQMMDCVLAQIKAPRVWRMVFIGLYPAKCLLNGQEVLTQHKAMTEDMVTINPILKESAKSTANKSDNAPEDTEDLLYWFVLRPSVVVPIKVAERILKDCVGEIVVKYNKTSALKAKQEADKGINLPELEDDKQSTHSSWMVDANYSFHNMSIGDTVLRSRRNIEVFESEYLQFEVDDASDIGNGVKIDQIAIYDLNYLGSDQMEKTTVFKVVNALKCWVSINQLYSQCFDRNYKKWKISGDDESKVDSKETQICKVLDKFTVCFLGRFLSVHHQIGINFGFLTDCDSELESFRNNPQSDRDQIIKREWRRKRKQNGY